MIAWIAQNTKATTHFYLYIIFYSFGWHPRQPTLAYISYIRQMNEQSVSNHLANERTFLAWVRTGIGIMAFGFVVVKFSLFIKEISLVLNKDVITPQKGYSSILGILLVAFGILITLLAYFRYKRVEKQLNDQNYSHSSILISILMVCIFSVGVALVIYLARSSI